jgi:predicted phage terminase large subunit-like protein
MTEQLLQSLLRTNLSAFSRKVFATLEPGISYQHNWHIDHLCWQLSRVERGDVQRLIINVPPRSMKSILVSNAFVAWYLGRDPTRRVICASYASELAEKLSADTKRIFQSPWFKRCFPKFCLSRQRANELATTQRGYRLAAGMNGSILGRGADLIVVDDPIKAVDALSAKERQRVNDTFNNSLLTRLDHKTEGAIVVIMQRLHEDDLVGHLLETGDWEHVTIPAIAPEAASYRLNDTGRLYTRSAGEVLHAQREPLTVLETLQRAQGTLTFSAQYQQAPIPVAGNIIKREWIRYFDEPPAKFDRTIVSWDTASTLSETADYSVGTVWGSKGLNYYLLDLVRGRWEFPALRRKVDELSSRWKVNQTIIEDTDTGRALAQDLRRTKTMAPLLHRPRLDKEARFLAQSARFESGQVHVPKDAPWLGEWMAELIGFPNKSHDDQVDSTSQALYYLTGPSHAGLELPKRVQRPAPMRPTGHGYHRTGRGSR